MSGPLWTPGRKDVHVDVYERAKKEARCFPAWGWERRPKRYVFVEGMLLCLEKGCSHEAGMADVVFGRNDRNFAEYSSMGSCHWRFRIYGGCHTVRQRSRARDSPGTQKGKGSSPPYFSTRGPPRVMIPAPCPTLHLSPARPTQDSEVWGRKKAFHRCGLAHVPLTHYRVGHPSPHTPDP